MLLRLPLLLRVLPCLFLAACGPSARQGPVHGPPGADTGLDRAERWVHGRVDSTRAVVERSLAHDSTPERWLRGEDAIARAMIHARDTALEHQLALIAHAGPIGARWARLLRAEAKLADLQPGTGFMADSLLAGLSAEGHEDEPFRKRLFLARLEVQRQAKSTAAIDSLMASMEEAWQQDSSFNAMALRIAGSGYIAAAKPDMAEDLLDRALQLAIPAGPSHTLAKAWIEQAYAVAQQGDYAQGAQYALKADSLFKLMGNARDRISALNVLGYAYWGVLDAGTELALWREALHLADSLGEDQKGAMVRLDIARFFVSCDSACAEAVGLPQGQQFDTAMALAREVQHVAMEHEDAALYGRSLKIEAAIFNFQGAYAKAIEASRSALPMFEAAKNSQWTCAALVDIASNQISLKDWPAASQTLEQAHALAKQHGYGPLRMLALNRLQYVAKQQGRPDQALHWLEAYIAVKDSVEGVAVTEKLAQQDLRHKFAQKAFADSLAHAAQLQVQQQIGQAKDRSHQRRLLSLGIGALLLAAVLVAFFLLDRRRRRERFAKQAALLETKALRAQMNPHFLFNALNSISAFIRQQEPEKAHAFIARFSRLMRLVLENSRHTAVALKDDLEALRLYMELEQARTQNKFDMVINVDPAIDPGTVLVPPMVMQPFVENAIWHGIGGLEGRGRVEVGIHRPGDGGKLVMTVTDDGVGRAATAGNKPRGEPSLGTTITRERLDQLAQQTGREAGFRYTDQAQGTRVEVVIPLQAA